MVATPPESYKSVYKRAAEIAEKDTMLAYAVGNELRKRLVGHSKEKSRQELLSHLAYTAYNNLLDLQNQSGRPEYNKMLLDLIVDTVIMGHAILTDNSH